MAKSVKDIKVKVIPSNIANPFIKKYHYSGKYVQNSKLHFGCYLDNILHGVMSYGSPMDKGKVMSLVDTNLSYKESWNRMLELNRMAFDDVLPKNSESRCLSISFRLIKKYAPHIDWILSFSDGTASGDGTIYRAVGFNLTQIRKNTGMYVFPDGERVSHMTLTNGGDIKSRKRMMDKWNIPFVAGSSMRPFIEVGAKPAEGYQLRYIKILNPKAKLNCDILPYDEIDKVGAGMLRGEKIKRSERMGR